MRTRIATSGYGEGYDEVDERLAKRYSIVALLEELCERIPRSIHEVWVIIGGLERLLREYITLHFHQLNRQVLEEKIQELRAKTLVRHGVRV